MNMKCFIFFKNIIFLGIIFHAIPIFAQSSDNSDSLFYLFFNLKLWIVIFIGYVIIAIIGSKKKK